jgi:hypothetical protein
MSDAGVPCAAATHEMLVRNALRMPKQPAVHFVEIEGGRRKDEQNNALEPHSQWSNHQTK